MLDLRQLIRLKQKGFSNREIAKRTGSHRNTVNSYLAILTTQEEDLSSLLDKTDTQLQAYFPAYQPPKRKHYEELRSLFPEMEKDLKHPGCTFQSL